MSTYLFVYGTLRRNVGHPMHKILSAGAEPAGEGAFRGRLFDLGRYPGAVPDNTGRWRVRGEIYRLRSPETVLNALDEYEGCAPRNPQPHQYRRELQPVEGTDGEAMEAWIYLYNAPLNGAPQIESGDFLAGREPMQIKDSGLW